MKKKKKITFLKKKYGQKKRIPDQLEGITIADREIPLTFSSEPKGYGGGSINEKEKRSILWKHCKEKRSSEIQQFQMNVTGVRRDA